MKRIIFPALIVPLLLFLVPNERSIAKQEPRPNLAGLEWKVVRTDVVKTDLGDGLPEVAVLRVSNEQFKEIRAGKTAAMKFFDNGIFKRKLIKVAFCSVKRNEDGDGWILMAPHTPQSTAYIIAWQIPKKDRK